MSVLGVGILDPRVYTSPSSIPTPSWYTPWTYPSPGRDLGPGIPTPCGQADTCENITFLQLSLRAVKIYSNNWLYSNEYDTQIKLRIRLFMLFPYGCYLIALVCTVLWLLSINEHYLLNIFGNKHMKIGHYLN